MLAQGLMSEVLPYRQMSNLSINKSVAFLIHVVCRLLEDYRDARSPLKQEVASVRQFEKTNCIVNLIKECINYIQPILLFLWI